MANGEDVTLETEIDIPAYQQKKFVEHDPVIDQRMAQIFYRDNGAHVNKTMNQLLSGPMYDDTKSAARFFQSLGLGDMTASQITDGYSNSPEFVAQYLEPAGLGRTYSSQDLAQEALSTDPNWTPGDNQTLETVAQDIESRGLTNEDREDIQTLATTKSVTEQLDRVTDPGKFLTDEEKAQNLQQAQTLLSTVYGGDYQDTEGLGDFLAQRIAEGESPYELSQFLKTTPDYMQRQADIQSQKAAEEATAARSALNEELLRSQQEVFNRATPSIISSYMRAGRLGSSGLNAALARAQQELESERQGYMANVAFQQAAQQAGYNREDFVAGQNAAFRNYLRQNEPAYQQKFALQDVGNQLAYQQPFANLSRQYSLADQARQRQYALEDYNRQQSDFNQYLSQQRRQGRQGALAGLGGSALQAAITGLFSR